MSSDCPRDWDGYDSSFEDDADKWSKKECSKKSVLQKSSVLQTTQFPIGKMPSSLPGTSASHSSGIPSKSMIDDVARRTESYKSSFLAMNAYNRHKKLVRDYFLYFPGSSKLLQRDSSNDKTDYDIIKANHRFLWNGPAEADTWERQLAKKYHDKLFKEYCISDLLYFKENKIGMRWRTEKELADGKGQFICGDKRCETMDDLKSWEVNFCYTEEQERKNTLVKLRLCLSCSMKLNFCHQRKEVTKRAKKRKMRDSNRYEDKKTKSSCDFRQSEPDSNNSGSGVGGSIWKEPAVLPELKSRDEEYDEYLDDLLL